MSGLQPGDKFTLRATVPAVSALDAPQNGLPNDEEKALPTANASSCTLTWIEHNSVPSPSSSKRHNPLSILPRRILYRALYHLLILLIWLPTLYIILARAMSAGVIPQAGEQPFWWDSVGLVFWSLVMNWVAAGI